MNRGKGLLRAHGGTQHGYTIIEVLIFLAVSALLFTATMVTLSGRQQRAQFNNAVRDFQTKLEDIANDVSNGYYQTVPAVGCNDGVPNAAGSAGQGANIECIFLGRLVKFGTPISEDRTESYGVYSIVGKRTDSSGRDVTNLADAVPRLLWTGSLSPISPTDEILREQQNIGFGARIICAAADDTCTPGAGAINSIAFMTRLTGGAEANTTGGSINADVYVYSIDVEAETPPLELNGTRLEDTFTMCLVSGTTNQHAVVRLGSEGGGGLTVTTIIREGEIAEGDTCGE